MFSAFLLCPLLDLCTRNSPRDHYLGADLLPVCAAPLQPTLLGHRTLECFYHLGGKSYLRHSLRNTRF